MTPGSLPGLSAKARALLAAEREIVPTSPELRWRAQLRARTAVGQARGAQAPHLALISSWKWARVLLVAALVATSALAAWHGLAPEPLDAPPSIAIGTAQRPTAKRPPRAANATATATATASAPAPPVPAASAPETHLVPAMPKGSPAGRARADNTRRPTTPSVELTLLDSARRAVQTRNFERALRILERHAGSFPKSTLAEEREALRVRALQGAGRSIQANHAAREFESRYPRSVLATELNHGD